MKLNRLLTTALLVFVTIETVSAQDSLSINSITIATHDSLEARTLLKNELKPASEIWEKEHNKPGNYRATNKFVQLIEVAYPINSPKFKTVYVDSVLAYMDQVIIQHPNKGVRAEFLFKALQLAHQIGKEDLATQYFSKMASEYGESHYASKAEEYAPNRAIQKGKAIPKFQIPTLTDTTKTYSNRDFSGQIYLLDFWGTWCGPCIAELPFLHKAYQRYKDHGFTILSIAIHDTHNAVQDFRKNEWPMPWHHSFIKDDSTLEDKVVSRFEVYGVPKTILVNKQGNIIATEIDLRG